MCSRRHDLVVYASGKLEAAARAYQRGVNGGPAAELSVDEAGKKKDWRFVSPFIWRLVFKGQETLRIERDLVTGGRLAERVQSTPKQLRHHIHLGAGRCAVSYDYSSAHAYIAGVLSGDEEFLHALRDIGYEGLGQLLVPGSNLPRSIAKNEVVLAWLNHSTPLQTYKRLMNLKAGKKRKLSDAQLGITKDSQPLLDPIEEGHAAFKRRFRKLHQWKERMRRHVRKTRRVAVRLPSGVVLEVRLAEGKQSHKILSAIYLTLETRFIARAQARIDRPCLDMHDGFLIAVPEDSAKSEAERGARILVDSAVEDGFDIPVKVGIGSTWGEAEGSAERFIQRPLPSAR